MNGVSVGNVQDVTCFSRDKLVVQDRLSGLKTQDFAVVVEAKRNKVLISGHYLRYYTITCLTY